MIAFVGNLRHFNNVSARTNTSISIFFNCERMTISLFKYHCELREDGTTESTCEEFSQDYSKKSLIGLEMTE